MSLAGKDYFTVEQAADYAGISYSHWRARVQPEFPPGKIRPGLTLEIDTPVSRSSDRPYAARLLTRT